MMGQEEKPHENDGRNERNAKRNARNEINKVKTESLKVVMILRLSALIY
jgi:hypothetical protein